MRMMDETGFCDFRIACIIQHAHKKITRSFKKLRLLSPLLRRSWLHKNISYYRSANPSNADEALMEQLTAIRIKNLRIEKQTTRSCKEEDARSHV